uniref:(northern house mosquito) hypothetical protein n=1 Tax=Culex pipiens TaxID=7175 RepID=A0A8D8BF94_CULPI
MTRLKCRRVCTHARLFQHRFAGRQACSRHFKPVADQCQQSVSVGQYFGDFRVLEASNLVYLNCCRRRCTPSTPCLKTGLQDSVTVCTLSLSQVLADERAR